MHAPAGFAYHPDFLDAAEEAALVAQVAALPFTEIRMRGQVARRRTVHLGWLYGYESWRIEPGPPIPEFLVPVRERAARLVRLDATELVEVLITEYTPGAGIGWHRDAPMFGVVVGLSLLSACRFRFQRGRGADRETVEKILAPRSAYVLDGEVRWRWQHSIPPMAALRYSITFRTLQPDRTSERPAARRRAEPTGDAPGVGAVSRRSGDRGAGRP